MRPITSNCFLFLGVGMLMGAGLTHGRSLAEACTFAAICLLGWLFIRLTEWL